MKKRNSIITVVVNILIILVCIILCYFNAVGFWDAAVFDLLNQKESVTNKKIYIIGIDDKTLEKYGPVNTWSRNIPAQLVELLNADPASTPAVIGFDVIYSENVEQEADNRFADACKEAGNVVAAMTFSFKEQPETDEKGNVVYNPYYVDYVLEPYESLKESLNCGFVNTLVDRDGYVRQAMAYLDYNGERVYSFSSQIYKAYQEYQGKEAVFPDTYGRNNRFYFSYSGKSGGYSVVSMADVLDGTVDAKIFQDAIVLVGAYAVGMQDSYMPAISHSS